MSAQGPGSVNPAGQSAPSHSGTSDETKGASSKQGVSSQGRRVKGKEGNQQYIPRRSAELSSSSSERSVSPVSAQARLNQGDSRAESAHRDSARDGSELLYEPQFEVESAETPLVEAEEDAQFPEEENEEKRVNEQALESTQEATEKGGILNVIGSVFSGKKGAALGCLLAGFLIMGASVFAAAFPPLGAAILAVGLCFIGVGTVLLLDACLDPQQAMPQLPGNNGNNGRDGNNGSDGNSGDDGDGGPANTPDSDQPTGGQYHASLRQDDDSSQHNTPTSHEPYPTPGPMPHPPRQNDLYGDSGKQTLLPPGRLAVVPVSTSETSGKPQGKFVLMPTGEGQLPSETYQRYTREQMHHLVSEMAPVMGLDNNQALQKATDQLHGQLMLQPEKSINPTELATPQMVHTLRGALPNTPDQGYQLPSESTQAREDQLAELNFLIGQLAVQVGQRQEPIIPVSVPTDRNALLTAGQDNQQDQGQQGQQEPIIFNDSERRADGEPDVNQTINIASLKAELQESQRMLKEQLNSLYAQRTSLEADDSKSK
ncbi:hypothetical protein CI610_01260 [invertebrate metagenome]|uniref:Transmembrane protein n=1 Tax=invertebrate metagenome TaxID=1711999 RepID=A0A2H9T9D6_9ZZZZ